MARLWNSKGGALVCAAVVGGALVAIGALIGAQASQPTARLQLPETVLNASAASGGESLAIATGPVDGEMEGLFTLDFLTGDLQCFVLYNRGGLAGKVGGVFKVNVLKDLGVDGTKTPKYLLITGEASFIRGATQARPGMSVAYVVDENTGNFAAYGLQWQPNLAQNGQPQAAPLIFLDKGVARTAAIRN